MFLRGEGKEKGSDARVAREASSRGDFYRPPPPPPLRIDIASFEIKKGGGEETRFKNLRS